MSARHVDWLNWEELAISRDGWVNTWIAEFGAGFLVLHNNPTGNESLVYVPHAVSGLGPQGDDEAVRSGGQN